MSVVCEQIEQVNCWATGVDDRGARMRSNGLQIEHGLPFVKQHVEHTMLRHRATHMLHDLSQNGLEQKLLRVSEMVLRTTMTMTMTMTMMRRR